MPTISTRSTFGRAAGSLEQTRAGLGVPRPTGLRALSEPFLRDLVFDEPIVTDEPLGGRHSLTVSSDGRYRYQGHLRATGLTSFEVAIVATLRHPIEVLGGPPAEGQVAFAAHGEVHGSNEAGGRGFAWDEVGQLPLPAAEWDALRGSRFNTRLEFDSDLFGDAGDIASFFGQVFALSATFGAAGVAIVLAGKAADLLDIEQCVLPGMVGVVMVSGAAYVLGPGVLYPAFLVGAAVTATLVQQRVLRPDERTFADLVFSTPSPGQASPNADLYDRIRLTNLVGLGGRPFTTPGLGGAILVNLGEGFDYPVSYTGRGGAALGENAAGQLLIHELTHAWQIAHESFTPSYYCRALSTAVGTVGGDMSAYSYGSAGPPWGDFGTEQQASIVDEWFAGSAFPNGSGVDIRRQGRFPMRHADVDGPNQNPYFRYLRDNIRAGIA